MGEELVPIGGGELAVFLVESLGTAPDDEGPVVSDDVLGVDRLWRRRISALSEYLPAALVRVSNVE
ncbi:hypothetical protein [Dactylosporangium matsuzakiense]|uniref:Uncharacterized protein n=1 Tax=Dactylosporangium matsuzakiense TaxID=53360 RepID=A0A9W6NIY3_9ACTN|nr:hypothetical protein [Dactylosporangium matsuzakiense]GLK99364.1 hypothetical protein GCM10017581_011050 [Dactylosporangium matsuzakiense]